MSRATPESPIRKGKALSDNSHANCQESLIVQCARRSFFLGCPIKGVETEGRGHDKRFLELMRDGNILDGV